ncbi:hypothetical protein G4Z16_11415 [Streptomyces bathyalis]|uniref:Uncharacterized protein n=1 Tax=Streptomyces bathyalis TaxID=2710756 RepID=A0A7T1WRU3_9ACTN|nr:hypothetical protein [Streptomyces bathyalis]QPP06894.1 hypothetical protein G4Z16_11415 [Streptomyces bathyalis]
MADDDRYRWLDDEAAERLLHGQVVNARSTRRGGRHAADHDNAEGAPTSGYGRTAPGPSWARAHGSVPEQRTGEETLDFFLDSLVAEQTATLHALGLARTGRVPAEAGGELPGEAAAVEAFREANLVTNAGHSGTVDISAGPTEAETVVGRRAARENQKRRSRDRRPGATRRTPLMGRPLRAGFAMAVAGCALGGAAVAAGTGVLPTPFGGGGSPAASVSPLASPDEREDSAGAGGSPYDGNGPRRGTRGGDPSDSPSGEDLAGKERGRDGKSKGPAGDEDWWNGNGKGLTESDKKAMARALCNAYEDDKLSTHDRFRLELVAGGPEGVKKWCDRHDGGRDDDDSDGVGSSGGVGAPGGPDGPGGPGGDDGGNDDPDGGDDGSGYSGGESGGDEPDGGGDGGSRPDDSGGTDGTDSQSGDSDGLSSPDASPTADETAPAGAGS